MRGYEREKEKCAPPTSSNHDWLGRSLASSSSFHGSSPVHTSEADRLEREVTLSERGHAARTDRHAGYVRIQENSAGYRALVQARFLDEDKRVDFPAGNIPEATTTTGPSPVDIVNVDIQQPAHDHPLSLARPRVSSLCVRGCCLCLRPSVGACTRVRTIMLAADGFGDRRRRGR